MLDKSKKSGILFIVLAVIIALIVAGLSYYAISGVTKKSPVLVLEVELQKGDPITKDKFKIVNVPTASIIKGTVNPNADLTGYVAAIPMMPGEVLKSSQMIKVSENAAEIPLLSARLKGLNDNGLVAGEIPLESMKGMLDGMKTGDKISIVNVYTQDNPSTKEKVMKSETIIACAETIGVRPAGDNSSGAIIVALTRDESELLAMSRERGKVYAYLLPYGIEKHEVEQVSPTVSIPVSRETDMEISKSE